MCVYKNIIAFCFKSINILFEEKNFCFFYLLERVLYCTVYGSEIVAYIDVAVCKGN